jgi:nucleoid DNA-binding protein
MATTKKDMIDRIAESTGAKRTSVKTVVQGFFDDVVAERGKGERLECRDLGLFETRTMRAR